MKGVLTLIIFVLITAFSFGQNLNGYKYVYVQTLKYNSGRIDIWSISSRLRTDFNQKGFIVLTESSTQPYELKKNQCLLLRCFIDHTNVVTGVNEVSITLKNCKNKVVHSKTGSAMGWSVQDDFNKATRRAFASIRQMSYKFELTKTPEIEYPEVEKTTETEESLRNYFSVNKLSQIEGIYKSYQSEDMPYYKIGIKKYKNIFKAIILESEHEQWKVGEVKAVFEPSSMKGFYSTKWYMGNKSEVETFAILENPALLSIEFKNPKTGDKRTSKFIKMYPPADSQITFKEVQKSSGSGFFLTANGIIATNAHVVESAETLKVLISNEVGNFEYSAKILLVDSKNDVALIKIADEKFKGLSSIPYSLVEKAEIGEKAFTIGYPLNDIMGTNFKVTDGIVSSISGIDDDMRYYQISVPLQPGNSGGPLFNKMGNIIGITSAQLNSKAVGTNIENVNYAIKISYLLNLFNMLPNVEELNTTPMQSETELQEQVKILKNYVCLIKVN